MARNEYYVDPDAGNNGNTGLSDAQAWLTLQYALDNASLGTDGTRINLKDSANNVLAASLTSVMAPTDADRLAIQGYTATAGDGGVGVIDGNASYSIWDDAVQDYLQFIDLTMQNVGARAILNLDKMILLHRVFFSNAAATAAIGVDVSAGSLVQYCRFETDNDMQLQGANQVEILDNYFEGAVVKHIGTNDADVMGNIIYSTGGTGIDLQNEGGVIKNNSILGASPGASKYGINASGVLRTIDNNIVEGFADTSNVGIRAASGTYVPVSVQSNYSYNNTTHYSLSTTLLTGDNEEATETAFAKSGAITFANRFAYFAPKNVGNVFSPAYGQYKGAVVPAGGGLLRNPGLSGGVNA